MTRKRILFLEGNLDGTVGGSYWLMYDLVMGLDRARFEPIVGFHRENFLVDKLRTAGIETIVFPAHRAPAPRGGAFARLLAPLRKLVNVYRGLVRPALRQARFLRERRIDLVNLNNSITGNHPWMVACMLSGTKCVTHEMGINKSYSFGSRYFGRRLHKIISLSHAIHDGMKACGIDWPNIVVIHCGIDLDRYKLTESPETLRRKHGIPEGVPLFGVVGNIKLWKGQETAVRATAILKKTFPDIRCILVGDTSELDRDYHAHLDRLCDELDIKVNVIYAGFQRNAIDYMEMMDVVAHTSVQPEPFGIVTLEAMSRAKPLVSTTIGGPAEVVVNGESGLLVDVGRPELLAGAVQRLLADRAQAAVMGRRGYERLVSHFALRDNLAKTQAVYDAILGN